VSLLEQHPPVQTFSPAVEDFILRFQLQQPRMPAPLLRGTRHAAVLIPIICREEPTILLTRRSDSLRKHAGQVAFPGGAGGCHGCVDYRHCAARDAGRGRDTSGAGTYIRHFSPAGQQQRFSGHAGDRPAAGGCHLPSGGR
jgi:hypothetical protein